MAVELDVPNDKQTLVEMLRQACELEHALACQYLYAGFTMKQPGDEGLTPSQGDALSQWKQQIMKVAIQEMYHLMLANNLLTAIDAEPSFARANFPQKATRYSEIGLPSMLTPFDAETIKRFVCWEKPEEPGWWDDWCTGSAADAQRRVGPGLALVAAEEPPPYNTIGQLYGLIDDTFKAHPEWIDPAQAERQVTSAIVPFSPKVHPITTYADAHKYIHEIVSEGEGTADWDSMSHFAYFHQINNDLGALAPPEPSWPTVDSPVYDPANELPGAALIDDPAVQPVGALFNDLYLLMVGTLSRLFLPNGETPQERAALANAALVLMPLGVKRLGTLLTQIPAGDAYPGRTAGPSFELPQVIPVPDATCAEMFADLHSQAAGLATRCRLLSIDSPTLPAPAQQELAGIAASFETIVPLFDPRALAEGAVR
jgi:hypothetical protein